MLKSALSNIRGARARNTAMVVAGMGAIMTGRKRAGLSLFAQGFAGLERKWREDHPDFEGGLAERWDEALRFYELTHADDTNRWLHIVGIPMIVGGGAGLLVCVPHGRAWKTAAALFGVGWGLNIVGHALFEKNAPAFADDPLSFVAGPVWDVLQLRNRLKGETPASREALADEAAAA